MTHIKEGRHPVVEKYYTREVFIPNDINLDGEENIIKIITGPNMSGKSTYIRMAAIIQLMSQIGSYVPGAGGEHLRRRPHFHANRRIRQHFAR